MRLRQSPRTDFAVGPKRLEVPVFNNRGDLYVTELTDVAITTVHGTKPAKKDVSCKLHETLPLDDAFAVVLVEAFACIGL